MNRQFYDELWTSHETAYVAKQLARRNKGGKEPAANGKPLSAAEAKRQAEAEARRKADGAGRSPANGDGPPRLVPLADRQTDGESGGELRALVSVRVPNTI